MDKRKTMPVREFTKLLRQAGKAYKKNDMVTFNSIEKKLLKIGYSLFIKDGQVYVKQEGLL